MVYKTLKLFMFSKKILKNLKAFLCQKTKTSSFIHNQNNEDGMAVLETVPLLTVFIILMTYALGFWGSIHSGVLSAMAARNYAFETFRNRSHLSEFRENNNQQSFNYLAEGWGMRLHRIVTHGGYGAQGTVAESRRISFNNYNLDSSKDRNDANYHIGLTDPSLGPERARSPASIGYGSDNDNVDNSIWLQISYGYCLTLSCGDEQ